MKNDFDDGTASRFGLPACLVIPIAAVSIDAIEDLVGRIESRIVGRDGRVNAISVSPFGRADEHPGVELWSHPNAPLHRERLHPPRQVWVHVDYPGYRSAWRKFNMPTINSEEFLDHVQNREAILLRGYSHPYLRLCPVSRAVNTSGGNDYGGEGMEKQFVRNLASYSQGIQDAFWAALRHPIQYADPMDLTKMLDVAPGTITLPGVRNLQSLFYPKTA
jgi:hypothetical protein